MEDTHTIDDGAERRSITNRLRRLQGQIRGLRSMIAAGQECEAVLTQVMAARSALGQIGLHVIGYSMKRCLAEESLAGDERLIDRAFEVFLRYRALAAAAPPSAPDAPRTPEALVERLTAVESGLLAVQDDLDSGGTCEALVTRIGAVTSSLNEVALGVLGHSMRGCLIDPSDDRDAVIDSAVAVFLKYSACVR